MSMPDVGCMEFNVIDSVHCCFMVGEHLKWYKSEKKNYE